MGSRKKLSRALRGLRAAPLPPGDGRVARKAAARRFKERAAAESLRSGRSRKHPDAERQGDRKRKGHAPTKNVTFVTGPPAHAETVKNARAIARRHRAWELQTIHGYSYEQIAAQLTTEGWPCSKAVAYYDCQIVAGEKKALTKQMAEEHAHRQLATNQRVMRAHLARVESHHSAKVVLQCLDFEARMLGLYAPAKVQAVAPGTDSRRYEDLTEDQLETRITEMSRLLAAPVEPAPADTVDGVVVEAPPAAAAGDGGAGG